MPLKPSRRLLLAALALALGCGPAPPLASPANPSNPSAAPDPPSASSAAPEALLVLAELRFLRRGEPYLTLYRNGLLTERGEVLGTLHSNGIFVDLGGTLHITLNPDGTISIPGGTLVVSAEGAAILEMPGSPPDRLHFDAEGRVVGDPVDTRVEGMTAATRRTAMFALLLPDLLRLQRPPLVH